ncbi:putative Asp/Glu/hydantoin racemase [Seiridium unicorne]|uniref:Asp/Glu/hydantoin racemase n=1 Tax=Seiridium unicorne TaxID=138068 RepID=A0ABR2ULR3_9PEZI
MPKILVLNPNSSQSMTDGVKTVVKAIDLPQSADIHFYTAPASAPASINDGKDIASSAEAVKADAWRYIEDEKFDGILVACFSVHPLVGELQRMEGHSRIVTGIFEASILTALPLLKPDEKWGIVTTGKFWEKHLTDGVQHFLGAGEGDKNTRFAGVESTGLNASDFHHGVSPDVVNQKIREATKRLLKKGQVTCIVLGCAGMAGMEDQVRTAALEESGEDFAHNILNVIDGVAAGIIQAEQIIRQQQLLRR